MKKITSLIFIVGTILTLSSHAGSLVWKGKLRVRPMPEISYLQLRATDIWNHRSWKTRQLKFWVYSSLEPVSDKIFDSTDRNLLGTYLGSKKLERIEDHNGVEETRLYVPYALLPRKKTFYIKVYLVEKRGSKWINRGSRQAGPYKFSSL